MQLQFVAVQRDRRSAIYDYLGHGACWKRQAYDHSQCVQQRDVGGFDEHRRHRGGDIGHADTNAHLNRSPRADTYADADGYAKPGGSGVDSVTDRERFPMGSAEWRSALQICGRIDG
jgi:hypothetical protein